MAAETENARNGQDEHQSGFAGFALIAVLSSLMVITFVLAVAISLQHARVQSDAVSSELIQSQHEHRELIALAGMIAAHEQPSDVAALRIPGKRDGSHIRLQDVGGLIDLNTASPDLLSLLAEEFELSPAQARDVLSWRRSGKRFIRVSDFGRVAQIDMARLDQLRAIATVYSGRWGVAPDALSDGLRDLFLGTAAGGIVAGSAYATPPTGTTYDVLVFDPQRENEEVIGTVKIDRTLESFSVLAIY